MQENLPEPTLTGPGCLAWKIDIDARVEARRLAGKNDPPHTSLAQWVIEAKWAHPFWHSYVLFVIHLRLVPGLLPPRIYLQGATHEIGLFALSPDHPRSVNGPELFEMLHPANFGAQFVAISDAEAAARAENDVRDIISGRLSPDTDYLQHWIARYNASMIKGDPKRAGETIIQVEQKDGTITKIVHDPKAIDHVPNLNPKKPF